MLIYLLLLETDEERAQFQLMYERYDSELFGVAASILKHRQRAEDTVQQTWIKVIEQFQKLLAIPEESLAGYLVVMTRNTALDLLRGLAHEAKVDESWLDTTPSPERGETEYRRLVELIRKMPDTYRQVLELKFVLEWSNVEIAGALNLSESAASMRIQRGRKLLLERLKREGYPVPFL